VGIEGDVEGEIQARFATRAFIAAVAGLPDPGEIVQRALVKIHAPDAVGAGLGKIEPALGFVESGMVRQWNAGLHGALPVPGAARLAVPRERLNVPDGELKFSIHDVPIRPGAYARVADCAAGCSTAGAVDAWIEG
jgi:hypothetical protein